MPDAFGPEDFAAQTGVSRETLDRLKAYADILTQWSALHNLVARSTLPDLWQRHMLDSAQLAPLIPDTARTLADLGSGAGFPGLVLAAMLEGRMAVTLHDSTAKKCAFLTAAAQRMGVAVTVRNARMEELPPQAFDVVTARACAPLPLLLEYAHSFVGPNSVCLFLKGQNVASELTEAATCWKMEVSQTASLTDPSGAIVAVRKLGSRHVIAEKTARSGGRQPKGRRR